MEQGYFYFLTDDYYERFTDCGLMTNKGMDHGRPCYYCFEYDGVPWMIPISSQIDKYQGIYNKQSAKYRNYYGIRFGYVLGNKRAFLIQNICPVSYVYIAGQYINKASNDPVTIDSNFAKELEECAKQTIRLYKKHIKITLTNIDYILNNLNK